MTTTTVRGDYLVSFGNLGSVTNGDEMMRWMIVGILEAFVGWLVLSMALYLIVMGQQ